MLERLKKKYITSKVLGNGEEISQRVAVELSLLLASQIQDINILENAKRHCIETSGGDYGVCATGQNKPRRNIEEITKAIQPHLDKVISKMEDGNFAEITLEDSVLLMLTQRANTMLWDYKAKEITDPSKVESLLKAKLFIDSETDITSTDLDENMPEGIPSEVTIDLVTYLLEARIPVISVENILVTCGTKTATLGLQR